MPENFFPTLREIGTFRGKGMKHPAHVALDPGKETEHPHTL